MTRLRLFVTIVLAMAAAAGCSAQRSVDPAAEEAAIRSTDANWLAAATAHDLERVLPFWADDATILPGRTRNRRQGSDPPIRFRGVCHARIFDHLDD